MNISTLTKQDLENRGLIGEYILFYLKNDKFCLELMNKWSQQWGENGMIKMFCKTYLNTEAKTKNLVPWFMDRVFEDIQANKSNKVKLQQFVELLDKNDGNNLEIITKIVQKHNINVKRLNDFRYCSELVKDKEDKDTYMFCFFCDLIIHSEVIILKSILNRTFNTDDSN